MNRIIVFALVLFSMTMQLKAQTLSEEEVSAKMYQAFENAKSIIREKYRDPFHWAAFVMLD